MPSFPPSRKWCFTFFPETKEDPDWLCIRDPVLYIRWQREVCPDTQREHLQGVLALSKPMRMTGVKALLHPAVHLEATKDWQRSLTYVWKSETSVEGSKRELGVMPQQGKRSDLTTAITTMEQSGLDRVASELPSVYVRYHKGLEALQRRRAKIQAVYPRKVVVLIGPPGVGKTYWALTKFENVYRVLDAKKGWFDGLDGHQVALFDDVGRGSLPCHNTLKQLTDSYGLHVQVKGGSTLWTPRLVILTSNELMDEWYGPDVANVHYDALKRRVKVFYLPQGQEHLDAWAREELRDLLKPEEEVPTQVERVPTPAPPPLPEREVSWIYDLEVAGEAQDQRATETA